MDRIIGIRHRRKQTRDGDARPTQLTIMINSQTRSYDLETETDELDWVTGRYPVTWRDIEGNEDVSDFQPHHCKWRVLRSTENVADFFGDHMRIRPKDGKYEVITKVPTTYDGLRAGDRVVMVLGGSGDRLAFALSRKGEEVGATVSRVPPFTLKAQRGEASKDVDTLTLIQLWQAQPDVFYTVGVRDRALIVVKELFSLRQDTQRARIGCGQRIEQRFVGGIFLRQDGLFPEGQIEDSFDKLKANDATLAALIMEEEKRDKELATAVQATDVWKCILSSVDGCGPRIAAGLLAAIGNILRFEVQPNYEGVLTDTDRHHRKTKAINQGSYKLGAFCGAHVRQGGKYSDIPAERSFPRKRRGDVANWSGIARQSMYLLAEQWNRRAKSFWGKKLRENKIQLREKHPAPIEVESNGKKIKRYTDGHIHHMAIWRTITQFTRWLYREWYKLERNNNLH